MKLRALVCLLITFSSAAFAVQEKNIAITQFSPTQITSLQQNVENALAWRSKALTFAQEVNTSLKQGHLSPTELQRFISGAQNYMQLRAKLRHIAEQASWLVDDNTQITWNETTPTQIAFNGAERKIQLNPNDTQGQALLIQLKISLSAALVLYDNYLIGIYPFYNQEKVRYLLNHDNPILDGKLNNITQDYLAIRPRQQVARAFVWHERYLDWQKQHNSTIDENSDYLDTLIEQSPTMHYIREKGSYAFKQRVDAHITRITDDLYFLQRAFTFMTSKTFGNAVGLIEFRKGRLADLPAPQQNGIASQMQALDILLEKTPFRLTDKFIPGHYGHVAIWTGTEQQLTELGVWDHPAIAPYQQQIKNGGRIVEALRAGVTLNSLAHFLNIDDLLVLRQNDLSLEQKREGIIRLFQQIGKEYDFNFDVETDRRIVCSELAYVVYPNINWATDKSLGRYTISPDHIAKQALNNGPLQVILLYQDGKIIPNKHLETLQNMIGQSNKQASASPIPQ